MNHIKSYGFCSILLQTLLELLEEAHSAYSIRTTLNSLTTLGLEGEHMCFLIARVSFYDHVHT